MASLLAIATSQAQRTRIYVRNSKRGEARPFLPVVLTMLDNRVRIVEGIPVVPLMALREFLASVSRFDESLAFISKRESRT
jgi:hypothetical protein